MIKTLPLVVLASLALGAAAIATPVQANGATTECTTTYHNYNVPNPTKKSPFVGHFDANGVPQSIVTPSDSDTTCTTTNHTDEG